MAHLTFPQAGIITSLDIQKGQAKVFIPLLGVETSWIPVATGLLYETKAKVTSISTSNVQATNGNVSAPIPCPGSFSSWTANQLSAPNGTIERVDWGTLKVGDEVVVVFLNGDINSGVVIARL